jgi:hypothetical protein
MTKIDDPGRLRTGKPYEDLKRYAIIDLSLKLGIGLYLKPFLKEYRLLQHQGRIGAVALHRLSNGLFEATISSRGAQSMHESTSERN